MLVVPVHPSRLEFGIYQKGLAHRRYSFLWAFYLLFTLTPYTMNPLRNKVSLIGKIHTTCYQDAVDFPHAIIEVITIEKHILNDGSYGPRTKVIHQVHAYNQLAHRMNAALNPNMEVIIEGRLLPLRYPGGNTINVIVCTEFLILTPKKKKK